MKGRDRRLQEQGAQGLAAQWEGPEAGLQGWATRPPMAYWRAGVLQPPAGGVYEAEAQPSAPRVASHIPNGSFWAGTCEVDEDKHERAFLSGPGFA